MKNGRVSASCAGSKSVPSVIYTTTLEVAMLSLIMRLISAKRGWIDERTDPSPFHGCLAGTANEDFETTFRNEHVAAGVSVSEFF